MIGMIYVPWSEGTVLLANIGMIAGLVLVRAWWRNR